MPFLHVALVLQLFVAVAQWRALDRVPCVFSQNISLCHHPCFTPTVFLAPLIHLHTRMYRECRRAHTHIHTHTLMLVQEVVCKQVLRTTMWRNNPTWNKPAVCFILGWALLICVIYFHNKIPPRNLKEPPASTCRVSCTHTCTHTETHLYTVFYICKKTSLCLRLGNI